MTLSSVLYEAACRVSDSPDCYSIYWWSCNAVGYVVGNGRYVEGDEVSRYRELMGDEFGRLGTWQPLDAAEDLNWHVKDFRTFMLLMAAEEARANGL